MRSMILTFGFALLLPCAAQAGLVCRADIASLDFGVISVRDGVVLQTSGPVAISCSGGTAGAVVQSCVSLGAGSGGAAAGQSPRSLAGQGLAPLSYQLTGQNSFSHRGEVWQMRSYPLTLDANGAALITPMLYGEITAIGAEAVVGLYTSSFDAGLGATMAYGEVSCTQTGVASSFSVRAELTSSCSVSVTAMDFGLISRQLTAPIDQSAQITVSCTNAAPYTVGLGFGLHAVDAGPSGRRMLSGSDLLAYGVYHDAGRSLDWGTSPASQTAGTGSGSAQVLTVFGRIFSPQTPATGSYSDQIVVTVTY